MRRLSVPLGLLTIATLLLLGRGATGAEAVLRGYTIPLVDLAGQTERQTVVDREPGQYLGHPTTVLLEDGKTMIAVYPKGHGRGAIVMKRSTDGGRTWSERLPTRASWATSKEVPTVYHVVDAKGTKRLILFSGLYPIRMAVSEDDGKTWGELKPIGEFGGIVAMASLVPLHTGPGQYMALFHDDGRFIGPDPSKSPKGFRVYKTLSADGGLTWGRPEVVATHPRAHLCEPGAIRSPDGKQIAVLLRENSRKLNSFVIFSSDEGKMWTEPRELPGALTGDRHTGRYAPDGRLFVTFRDTTLESPTKGDWVGWVGTYEDIVQGREGQYRVRLMKNHKGADCAYPGLELLPDGTFVTTTYGHWTKGEMPYIVSVRFTLGEIDVQAVKSPQKRPATAQEAIHWLEAKSQEMIRASRRTMKSGISAFPPQAGGGYEAFWLRDYAYMLEGCPEAFSNQELRDACLLFVSSVRADGAGVDCVKFDGTPIYQPGYGTMGENPVADGGPFTIDVAWHTHRRLQDKRLVVQIVDRLIKTMVAVPRNPESGMVTIKPQGYDRCPYGFTDTVRKQGDELFTSLLWIQAARQLADLLKVADRQTDAGKWQAEADRVAANMPKVFWDENLGLFRAATLKCREPDIWGSAFAAYLGVASRDQSLRIARYFKDHYGEIVERGQLRHLPAGTYWEAACPRDTYQNGGYWATPVGWFIYTLDLVDPSLADKTLLDLVDDFQKRGVTEWVRGDRQAVRNYIASATMPLAGARAMLRRGGGQAGAGMSPSMNTSCSTQPPIHWLAISSPIVFRGDATTAYRDPAAVYWDGALHVFFTLVETEPSGKVFSYTAKSTTRDLVRWAPPRKLTPRDQRLNYCSPGDVIRFQGQWVLCLSSYPRPNGEKYGHQDARLWTLRSNDLEHWSEPELLRVKGPEVPIEKMGRMIDPYLFEDKDEPGKWWCFYKQNGVSMSWSRDLKVWTYFGRTDAGENACILVDGGEYVLFHSPANGIGIKRSKDLRQWRDCGLVTLGRQDWPWAKGRLTAGVVLDLRGEPGIGKCILFFHGSGPEDERTMFDTHASLGIAWSDDLKAWDWPRKIERCRASP
jgi:sucrose-6-phosphate hydrolase SacC (GH32 family)